LSDLWLATSALIVPGQGPDQGGFEASPSLLIGLFGIGFLVGVLGHLARSRTLIAAGILLVVLATFLIPFALHVSR
jgi:ABC-type phosphate transport system permease subunit